MAKTTEIYNTPCNLIVSEVEYQDKVTKENKKFNKYEIVVDGRAFSITLAPADRKLFEYILGI